MCYSVCQMSRACVAFQVMSFLSGIPLIEAGSRIKKLSELQQKLGKERIMSRISEVGFGRDRGEVERGNRRLMDDLGLMPKR